MFNRFLAGNLSSILCIFGILVFSSYASSQNNQIPRISEKIKIDGQLNEDAWSNSLEIQLNYEVSPAENIPARVQTRGYLVEDGEYLFVAIVSDDPEPDLIRAYLSERDNITNSDYVSISMDTFNDSRKAFKFSVNARGVQADAIIDEITDSEDLGWDGIWESATVITSSGFQVEMAIPLKSLRFEDKQEPKQWNIKLERFWPRDVEYYYSSVENDRNNDCSLCQYQSVLGFANVSPAKNLTLTPAVTVSKSDSRVPGNSEGWSNGDFIDRESLDLRLGLDQNIYLNATINPDFSQVEADAVQLQINQRFAISTTEKRAFFLDGADYFSNWSKLVHTRLFNEPEYGVKLTGKSGAHSYGLIALEDKDTNFLVTDNQSSRLVRLTGQRSENQILRYRYDSGDNGNFGLTYTNRQADDYSNQLFSIDGKYWTSPSSYFKFQAFRTETEDSEFVQQTFFQNSEPQGRQTGTAYSLNYTHSTRDWSAILTHHHFDEDVRVDAGFVSKSDWVSSAIQLAYHWYPDTQNQWWKQVSVDYTLNQVSDTQGKTLSVQNRSGINVAALFQSNFGFSIYNENQNFVPQKIQGFVNPELYLQDYLIRVYEVYANLTPIAGLDLGITYEWGEDVDFSSAKLGKLRTITPSIGYQLNDHWRFTVDYINQRLIVDDNLVFDIHLSNYRAAYQIDLNHSLRLTLQSQREGTDKSLASQLLYSYKVNPFTLIYLGYSDNAIADDQVGKLTLTERSIFVKFSYAWQL